MASVITSNSTIVEPLTGGCYCGTITYTMKASPIFVNCCHCRNCQQLSGSAFALNIMIEASNVEITSTSRPKSTTEDERPAAQKNEQPKSGGGVRCPNPKCGSLLWGTHPFFSDKIIFLRAGTLKESDRIVPDAHFFIRSKHPWIVIPEGVRQFETLGGKNDPPLWSLEGKKRVHQVMTDNQA
ncbi:uncharacterized protein A1O9_00342 [Exophiala aquamarina CBS 119918]|uniref:CENP-V/GFA domain-containing protein n=1 Tax=Exophiala aquamarina CBS 119918 TaxID=1182545 RepID=A0A072Q398_9EURO|nr:uncharacterized protein A1O9_00342 [Exophiala aquamarina CBS 119918]KEF62370.1 hypothetical protein A1O9_00342 [Exophiala aquamarina CBS 119918]